ncbi:AAA family ATPase (plasmid) [Tritonibacter mobilis]|nr:AAA family ATPase [Tritonibacter mobilis]WHQ85118.1 AAA family ATPase [Tritonibacter mobilis]
MYVPRPEHERALRRGIQTGYNIVLFGDSGCGKSWLYKKVFKDERIYYRTLDFSSSENVDEVDFQMLELVSSYEEWQDKERKQTDSIDFKPARMGAGRQGEVVQERIDRSPFFQVVTSIRSHAGKRTAYLVLENLEYILDKPDIVRRIQKMLLALDDPDLGRSKVRICLVGVPSEIKEILSDGNRFQTISNRVYEVPELSKLDRKSVDLLILRGLEQELDYEVESKTFCCGKIAFATYQIPQYVHDVCLHVALRAEDEHNIVTPDLIDGAVQDWVMSNSRQGVEFIRKWIMADRSQKSVRAKTMFAISRLDKHFFEAEDVTRMMRQEFPRTFGSSQIQSLRTLRKMAEGNDKFLKTDAERLLFRVATPHLRSALRACLKKVIKPEGVEVKKF